MHQKIIHIEKHYIIEERRENEALIREYRDIFAWGNGDLKVYKGVVIKHTIPWKDGAKPF
jgi:hypothetical protein